MRQTSVVYLAFFFGTIGTLFGAWLKILHRSGADTLLTVGLIAYALFIITAVYEISTSSRIRQQEKIMWTIALILGGFIAGIIYMILGRKRVASCG